MINLTNKKVLLLVVSLLFVLFANDAFCEEGVTGSSTKEPLVTNVFSETDIRQALNDISTQCNVTIITDNTVQGMVSLDARSLPLEKCLKMLLAPGGYVFKNMGDYYLVGLPDPRNPSFKDLCMVKCIRTRYLGAYEIKEALPEMFSKYITINNRKDILTITAPEEIISQIEDCIKNIDLQPKQIMIEVIVTELSSKAMKSFGVDWNWEWNKAAGMPSVASGKVNLKDLIGNISYSTTGEFTRNALTTLRYLVENGDAKIRANPRVVAQDNEEASIYIGKEKYYSISASTDSSAYARLEMIRSGITLKIKPRIIGDEVTVEIEPEVSDVSGGEEALEKLPLINNRKVKTKVRVKDGQTIVIGGLVQQNERKGETMIPILSKLPVIGSLFKNKSSVRSENEIVILITPCILKDNGGSQT